MALSRLRGLMVLAALPGALGSEEGGSHNSVTVCLLVVLLLLLMMGLALAWYHLSRESKGYYHPNRLGTSLWRQARRLLRATGLSRWLGESSVTELQDSMEKQEDEEGEEEEDLEPEEVKEEQPGQQEKDGVPGSPEAAQGGDCPEQGRGSGVPAPASEPPSAGGSAEALLSDLHAFSGSAAWEDGAGTEGGQGLSVTAL
ncbi:protein tyrosine phosphatase receptor type C-associated protein [Dromiciops gliroides]|uniref:protein tyrosine phosphatase receptor type C-associated protein n=1 Tax=Dromiciops gliroides TaxID=33562 RepID=UPI001CC59972|nr:protein tyrosine phosphatase receptor type C-associated protein [Dromiciops gliroides]